MKFTLTPAAEKFIHGMIRFNGGEGCGFRLAVTAGGCSGLAAQFDVEAAPRAGASVFESDGIKFFLPAESRQFWAETTRFSRTPCLGPDCRTRLLKIFINPVWLTGKTRSRKDICAMRRRLPPIIRRS